MYECLLPLLLIGGLIVLGMYSNRRSNANRDYLLAQFDSWLDTWLAQGRIAPDVADVVRRLVAEERGVVAAAPAAVPGAMATATPPALAPSPAQQLVAAQPTAPGAAPMPPPPPPPLPVAARTAATAQALPPVASAPPPPPKLSSGERFWNALLALNTRRTLLVLGAFLLVMSGLTLVVFNWASFPPLVQFAMLAGVTAGLWGVGAWMSGKADLRQAGVNLQAVAALLVPVVGYALARPGLLDLEPRSAAALASALSLLAYVLATALTRRLFYSVAASLAGVLLVLTAPAGLPNQWLPLLASGLFLLYLGLAWQLERYAPPLARGPRWVANIGMPLALLSLGWLPADPFASSAIAATLWLGVVFYAFTTLLHKRPPVLYASLFLAPLALLATLEAASIGWPGPAIGIALLALAFVGLAGWLEQSPNLQYAQPLYIGSFLLALVALCCGIDAEAGRIVLPLVICHAASLAFLHTKGRTLGLPATAQNGVLPALLAFVGAVLPAWLLLLANLLPLSNGQLGLLFLPLGALYFAAARWWPGRLSANYDVPLQVEGALLVAMAWLATLPENGVNVEGALLAMAIWAGQATLRRWWGWTIPALGTALAAAALMLWRWAPDNRDLWLYVGLLFVAGYAIGGTLLRTTALRYWMWSALGWAGAVAAWLLVFIGSDLSFSPAVRPASVVVLLGLAGTLAALSWLWRKPWAGVGVAALLSAGVLLASLEGFFSGWRPGPGDMAYVLCGLGFALFGMGQIIRRAGVAYAHPYEMASYVLVSAAPLAVSAGNGSLTISVAGFSLLYGLGVWRYRIGWFLAPALVTFDLALLFGADWLLPAGDPYGMALVMLGVVWLQAIGLFAVKTKVEGRKPSVMQEAGSRQSSLVGRPWLVAGYTALAIGGGLAFWLALGSVMITTIVLFGLALLAGCIAQIERREAAAWLAFGLLLGAISCLHEVLGLSWGWSLAYGVAEMFALTLFGWGLDRFAAARLWRRVSSLGPLGAAGCAIIGLISLLPAVGILPLTFALATLALLLATLAVRERSFNYAYGAGASVVAAALCQLADWGFREPQWYVIPAGMYLLIMAACMRRFQGQQRVSRIIEAGAMVMLVGTTLAQALGAGSGGYGYDLLLFVEGLIFVGYGTLLRLRVPFLGGLAFFVAGVLSLSIETVPLVNPWVIFGGLGLLMVVAYVLLERRAEQLTRLGKNIVATLEGWG